LENGFSKAMPVKGGFEAWMEAGYPLEPAGDA
jgi:rhodanese-related sulfurtransferase